MKTLKILLSILCLLGLQSLAFTQSKPAKLDNFLITTEFTDYGIKLTCEKGCAWKELSFKVNPYQPQKIDQFGLVSYLDEKMPSRDIRYAHFLFVIQKTEQGTFLEGKEGTAWTKLSYGCGRPKCFQHINEFGMVNQ